MQFSLVIESLSPTLLSSNYTFLSVFDGQRLETPRESPDTVIETAAFFLALLSGDTGEATVYPFSGGHGTCF